jgi:aromatic amino acid aminotransferase I
MDIDGRVMRVDSFSKVLAPGMRLGWITASPAFTERLVVLTDSSTMHPHGFGQAFVLELFGPRGWGIDGFARWLHSLCVDYRRRRENFARVFAERVSPTLASANMPACGMFFWIEVQLEQHARYTGENTAALMDELFHKLLDDGVVMMPASIFAIPENGKTLADNHVRRC